MPLAPAEQLAHLRDAAELSGIEPPAFALPHDREVVANGLRLHYLDWGPAGRPELLFLHGGCLTAHTWDLVCLALRSDHRCLALDQRGHGDSEWSPAADYRPDVFAADVEAFVDRLGLERPVLVGQSLGGLAAALHAVAHSDRLAGLVMVDVGVSFRDAGVRRIGDFATQPSELDSVEEFVERARAFNPLRDPRLLRRSLTHNLRQLPNGRFTWKYDRRLVRPDLPDRVRERLATLERRLASIRCPTLIVRGAESDVFADEDAEALARRLPHGRLVRIERAGHTVQGDNPRDFAAALREFAAELEI